jgi:hypothetical protein
MSRTYSKDEQEQSLKYLREVLQPGDTVWTSVTHVARSGMTRWIRAFIIREGQPEDISWHVARVTGSPVNSRNHEGVERGGCGMDMGFDLVYSLSHHLFRGRFECLQYHVNTDGTLTDLYKASGYDRSRLCPSSDHSNHVDLHELITDGVIRHSDGGYALNQRWL